MPKEHYANIYEIDEEVAARAMKLAKKLATHMTKVLDCDGFNILQNNGEVAGQTVFHFHIHLVPRYKDGKNDDILKWTHEEFTKEGVGGDLPGAFCFVGALRKGAVSCYRTPLV